MRWRVLTEDEKWDRNVQAKCRWHKWFAWHPVRILDPETGHTIKTWLEIIGRKEAIYTYHHDHYSSKPEIGRAKYCFAEDIVFNALQNNDIEDEREDRYK